MAHGGPCHSIELLVISRDFISHYSQQISSQTLPKSWINTSPKYGPKLILGKILGSKVNVESNCIYMPALTWRCDARHENIVTWLIYISMSFFQNRAMRRDRGRRTTTSATSLEYGEEIRDLVDKNESCFCYSFCCVYLIWPSCFIWPLHLQRCIIIGGKILLHSSPRYIGHASVGQ